MNVLDTFSGAGGFSLGFYLAGYRIIGGIETDKWAAETFLFNHKNAIVIIDDIRNLSDDELKKQFRGTRKPDVILGGPPCQGFSICRKGAGDPKDPRNSLFIELLRVADILKPKILILENVPNLVNIKTKDNKYVIGIIEKELNGLGYYVYYDILEATNYGVPQIRKRLFVIASKKELKKPFPVPTHIDLSRQKGTLFDTNLKPCPDLWAAISDLPELQASEGAEEMDYEKEAQNEYQLSLRNAAGKIYNHKAMNHSKRMVLRFSTMKCGDSISDVPFHHWPLKRNGNGEISKKIYDQNNRRMRPDKTCHTIPASFYANFVHPYQHRNFTAREGARIQSFPDWYVFKGKPTVVSTRLLESEGRFNEKFLCQYNQIGNAVPPLLAASIAKNLLSNLGE
ncbi:MAG: DNA cytosine methyltransferase [Deltaproteobacteria bacterium]|nr:DNA cytosine methyltransferase [Deltaproteobacteria bacterium]MCL4873174.1 DNA cytosine methyltransferase [bacterium]